MDKGIPLRSHSECQRWTATILEVIESSVIPLVSVLRPLLILPYVNFIWRNMESTFRLFAMTVYLTEKL